MRLALTVLAATVAATGFGGTATAQEGSIYFPSLVYRSGPYAPNGIPWANGVADYVALVNERDGGIEGIPVQLDECETGYSTDRGVECYERLKSGGIAGATVFSPLSTGITFALTEKAPVDDVPLLTMGYGRSESADGTVFRWNFPLLGTYWTAADILVQHFDQASGLKGKKVVLLYHDSPFGKEPIPVLEDHAKTYGYDLELIPITPPGVEQKSAWLQVRRSRPDYVVLWGWGVMNSTAIKEAVAVGFPREKMFGVWWAGAEPDVEPAGADAKGYNALAMNPSGTDARGAAGDPDDALRPGQGRREPRGCRHRPLHPRHDRCHAPLGSDPDSHERVRQTAGFGRGGPLGVRASVARRGGDRKARL